MKNLFRLIPLVFAGLIAACDSPAPIGDIVMPELIAMVPEANATDVPVSGSIVLTFSEAMDTASLQVSSSPVVSFGATTWGSGNTVATLPLSAPLALATSYSLMITGKDPAGNPLPTSTRLAFITVATSCLVQNGGCHANADCATRDNRPVCTCKDGYEGDGLSCEASTRPGVAISQPEEGFIFNLSANAAQEIVGTVEDVEPNSVSFSIDGAPEQAVEVVDGAFRIPFALPLEDSTEHNVVVTAKDSSGNSVSASRKFVVDRVAPSVTIATPLADSTCNATSCTGAVNLASGDRLDFTGTMSDGGELAQASLTAKLDETSLVVLKNAQNGSWSTSWTGLASSADDGVFRTFEISARDAAGNLGVAKQRIIYIDRVRPTATVLVANKRRVGCTEPLLRFSELMDVASVQGATQLGSVAVGSKLVSTDSRTFGLVDCASMPPYEVLDLEVAQTARDRVGNTLNAAASERFMSAPKLPSTRQRISWAGRYPALVVDGDGNPFIAYWDSFGSGSGRFKLSWWNGKNAFNTVDLSTITNDSIIERPIFIELTDAPNDELLLSRKINVAFAEQTALYFAKFSMVSLDQAPTIRPTQIVATSVDRRFEIGPTITHDLDFDDQYTVVNYATALADAMAGSYWERWEVQLSSATNEWAAPRMVRQLADFDSVFFGDASYDDAQGVLTIEQTGVAVQERDVLSAFGSRFPIDMYQDPAGPGNIIGPHGNAYLMWISGSSVGFGCANSEDSPPRALKMRYLTTGVTTGNPRRVFFNTSPGAIESAITISTAANEVAAQIVPTTTCTAAPNVATPWPVALTSATEPSAAVKNGKLWVAAVSTADGQLFIVPPAN